MNSESSMECDPQSAGFPLVKCNPDAPSCPGPNMCGKSNRKCYCTTTLFPKPDPIRKARRAFEKELQPVNNNLSDLQDRVRAMYINEMMGCVCGAFIPDNPFPDNVTCTCSTHRAGSPPRAKSEGHKSNVSFSSKSSRGTASTLFDSRPSPCVCVGSIPFARTVKSSRSKSRSRKRSKSKSSHSHKSKKKHKSGHRHRSSRKSHKSVSTRKSSKKRHKAKESHDKNASISLKPLSESQQEFLCRKLTALARNMFYKGPVSHYLNQNSPVYYENICDCPSMDALADPRDRDRDTKRDVCALTTANFPLRPGQAMTTDPDGPSLREDTGHRRVKKKHKGHKSHKSKSPSVIKLKLRLKRSRSSSKRRGGKSKHSSRHGRSRSRQSHHRSSTRSASRSASRSSGGKRHSRSRTRSGGRSHGSSTSRRGSTCSSVTRSSSATRGCRF